jgi:hypothetical protein
MWLQHDHRQYERYAPTSVPKDRQAVGDTLSIIDAEPTLALRRCSSQTYLDHGRSRLNGGCGEHPPSPPGAAPFRPVQPEKAPPIAIRGSASPPPFLGGPA